MKFKSIKKEKMELMAFYLDGADRSWLKVQANKKKISVAQILRGLITNHKKLFGLKGR